MRYIPKAGTYFNATLRSPLKNRVDMFCYCITVPTQPNGQVNYITANDGNLTPRRYLPSAWTFSDWKKRKTL